MARPTWCSSHDLFVDYFGVAAPEPVRPGDRGFLVWCTTTTDPACRGLMATNWTLTFDCASPAALAAFWCKALGYVEGSPPTGFTSWEEWLARQGVPEEEWDDGASIEDPDGLRPRMSFLKVPEGKRDEPRTGLTLPIEHRTVTSSPRFCC